MAAAVLPIQVGDVWFAIEALQVVEILGARPWVAIPDAPSPTPGVLAWRGRAVAAVDLGAITSTCARLGSDEPRRRTVVVEIAGCSLAVPVDAVREVRDITDESVRPPSAATRAYAKSEADVDGILMPVLDLGAVVAVATRRSETAT